MIVTNRLLRVMAIGVALDAGGMLLVNVSFSRGRFAGSCSTSAYIVHQERISNVSARTGVIVPDACFGPAAPPWSENDPVPR